MLNRPFWSAVWPASLTREKRSVLIGVGFEYDYNSDLFVHPRLRKAASFDAVADMQLDELKAFANDEVEPAKAEFRFRGEPQEGLRELLMQRYGWA